MNTAGTHLKKSQGTGGGGMPSLTADKPIGQTRIDPNAGPTKIYEHQDDSLYRDLESIVKKNN